MRVVPAVDIRGGLCVNLVQGDFARETVFSRDPVAQAVEWRRRGAALVHIVDLDGAKEGRLCVGEALAALGQAGVPFEVGGGIRNLATLRDIFSMGAERAVLGTAAYRDPEFLKQAAQTFPGTIAVGIDARGGRVSLSGWTEDTDTDAVEFARQAEIAGAARIIYTDITRDGMLQGPDFDAARALARNTRLPVTVSGGVASLEDIRAAANLEKEGIGRAAWVDEIIVGRALYVGAFSLEAALAAAQG